MELGTAIAGILMLSCFIIPVIILGYIKKRNNKQIANILSDIAKQYNCLIDEYEFSGKFIIGIDKNTKVVFFFQKEDPYHTIKQINLSDFKSAKALIARRANSTKDKSTHIDRLALAFQPLHKQQSTIELEFYNSEVSLDLNGELQTLEKWAGIISNQIDKKLQTV
ncbi:hypothetical protein BZG02_07105 [Labilibaculum filiforme]|uniref:Uncharacterized protein n=1 Tax=Labilibaculum filiforme TaxID=1940526 RepID=A0A2N3I0D8_9BACT|nr:hypothetical protein [Labilibaculum filiforme]PKQ63788.1 hypothetical protein BZG02_07105 [Labilibaculum filiforme]